MSAWQGGQGTVGCCGDDPGSCQDCDPDSVRPHSTEQLCLAQEGGRGGGPGGAGEGLQGLPTPHMASAGGGPPHSTLETVALEQGVPRDLVSRSLALLAEPPAPGLPAALHGPVLAQAPGPWHLLSPLSGALSCQPPRGQFRGLTQVSAAPPRPLSHSKAPPPFHLLPASYPDETNLLFACSLCSPLPQSDRKPGTLRPCPSPVTAVSPGQKCPAWSEYSSVSAE